MSGGQSTPEAERGPGVPAQPGARDQIRRIAVTGIGTFSPADAGLQTPGGRVPDFDPAAYIRNPRRLRTMHRSFQLATSAAVMAFEAAGLAGNNAFVPERAGLATAFADISPVTPDLLEVLAALPDLGSSNDSWARFAELGARQLHPFRRLALLANMASAHTSLLLNLQGPGFTFTSGTAAGLQIITESFWTIAADRADVMVAQSASSPEQAYSSAPESELAGAVILEDWDYAQRRKAPIVAEIVAGPAFPAATASGFEPATELMRIIGQLAAGGRVALADLAQPLAAVRRERRA